MEREAYLTERSDLPLLEFLWKWKVSTTAALAEKFYSQSSVAAAYLRLWRLEKAGFIRTRVDDRAKDFFWILEKRGYRAIRKKLPPLVSDGYLSENPGHDLIVTAMHLGEGLFGKLSDIEVFTEQELRRYDPEFYPEWVPRSDRHRPDGYWYVRSAKGFRTLALEIELTHKRNADYEGMARFYEDTAQISRVLWVVPKPALTERIQKCITHATDDESKHNFISLDPIYESGWQTEIESGPDQGKTISCLLENCSKRAPKAVFTKFLLDTRKSPHKSKHCTLYRSD